MINKIINEIKFEYRKNRMLTVIMLSMLGVSILTYIRPSSTSSIWQYFGITAFNLSILSAIIFLIWYFYLRRKIK